MSLTNDFRCHICHEAHVAHKYEKWSTDQISLSIPDHEIPWASLSSDFEVCENCYIKNTENVTKQNPELHYEFSIVYEQRGEFRKAFTASIAYIRLNPSDHRPYNVLGSMLWDLHKYRWAECAYNKGLSLSPKDPYLNHNLALLSKIRNKPDH